MCGFVALTEHERIFPDSLLKALEKDLQHRGPDSGGTLSEMGFALAFRRLAILDPKDIANQPMTDPTGHFTIVFNGEIYNFKEIRKELKKEGYKFNSNTDCEVLLAGWDSWGARILDRIKGMFAFVIWDIYKKKAYLLYTNTIEYH